MQRQEYLIETTDQQGRWYILGSEKTSGDAQREMHGYRKLFPKAPLRVKEYPSRVLIVCSDPTGEPFCTA